MKILLDECLPLGFRHSFRSHEAHTVQWGVERQKKWRFAARRGGCRLRGTADGDQGIPHQANATGRRLSIILIRSRTNQTEDLVPLVDEILRAVEMIQPSQTLAIPSSDSRGRRHFDTTRNVREAIRLYLESLAVDEPTEDPGPPR